MSPLNTTQSLIDQLMPFVQSKEADFVTLYAQTVQRRNWRFANQQIPQAQFQNAIDVTFKVIRKNSIGIASIGSSEPELLEEAFKKALLLAQQNLPLEKTPTGFPEKQQLRQQKESIAPCEDIDRTATQIQRLFHICQGADVDLAGSYSAGSIETLVMNSQETLCDHTQPFATTTLITNYGPCSGFAAETTALAQTLDLQEPLKRAMGLALCETSPQQIPLGDYEVILEPEAVADLIFWLSYTGFGAKAFEEGSSFLSGKIGEHILHPSLTLYDDGNESGMLKLPFDYEGNPRQRVTFVNQGKANAVVYDRVYAQRYEHTHTGHTVPFTSQEGPYPMHVGIQPGESTVEDMLSQCKRGLYIPRLHYVNGLLNPTEALMSGLTREGCYLIENGELTQPVSAMRFTQSIVEAFKHIKGLTAARRLVSSAHTGAHATLVPAMHLEHFQFTDYAH